MAIRVLAGEPGEQKLLCEFDNTELFTAMQYAAERFDWGAKRIWVEYDREDKGNYPWTVEVKDC